jgi:hypothetical protein
MRYLEPIAYVALLLAALLACGEAKQDPPRPAAPIAVSAADLTRDYATLGVEKGDAKWAGKDVRVSGIAWATMACREDAIARAFSGEHKPTDEIHCLMLEGGGEPFRWVRAWLAEPIKQFQGVGSSTTLKCRVPDDFAYQDDAVVSVENCAILSTGATGSARAPRSPPPSAPGRRPPPKKR